MLVRNDSTIAGGVAMNRLVARLCVGLGMLALVGSAVAADPEPLWTADLVEKEPGWTQVTWIGFSPDGRHVAVRTANPRPGVPEVGRAHARVWVWDLRAKQERYRSDLEVAVYDWHSIPRGAVLPGDRVLRADSRLDHLAWKDGKSIGVWTVPGWTPRAVWATADGKRFFAIEEERKNQLAFPGPARLVSGPLPFPAVQDTPSAPLDLQTIGWQLLVAALNPDGTRLVTVESLGTDRAGVLVLHAVETSPTLQLKVLARIDFEGNSPLCAVEFSPDGRVLASGAADGTVKLWDVPAANELWKERAVIPGGKGPRAYALAFRPDGKVLAVGVWERKGPNVWFVDVGTGKVVSRVRVPVQVTAVAFSPDGKTFATGNSKGQLHLWDADKLIKGE
jgi:WD40 repeat protein